jgi:hypothetical protein
MIRASILVFLAASTVGATAQAPQGGTMPGPPRRDTPTAETPPPAGTIRGRVVALDTGRPLNRAQVRLTGPQPRMVTVTQTNADGRFEVAALVPGRYGVNASKPGYVALSYGQQRPFEGGRAIVLGESQTVDQIDFALPRGSVITGRLTDEYGDPVAGVTVQALRYQYRPNGQRHLATGSTGGDAWLNGVTNDLGEFRIFGLLPGSYVVSARETTVSIVMPGAAGPDSFVSNPRQVTTYYPGTDRMAEAQTITLGLMQEASASFSIAGARSATVSGVVRDSQGRPASGGQIRMRPAVAEAGPGAGGPILSSGRFVVPNVDPGEYVLEIRLTGTAVASGPRPTLEFAFVPITVGSDDITGFIVTTSPGVPVSGRVIFDGTAPPPRAGTVRISATPEEDARNVISFSGPEGSAIDESGRIHIPSVAGRILFRTSPLPDPWMLKSATLNGTDITNTPLDTTGVRSVTDLEIVITDQQGRLIGYAKNGRGETMTDFRVVTYPYNPAAGDVPIRYMHNTQPDQTGRFQIGRMPAGEYIAAAIQGVVLGQEWNPSLRKRIEESGKRFTIKHGETLEIELPFLQGEDQ